VRQRVGRHANGHATARPTNAETGTHRLRARAVPQHGVQPALPPRVRGRAGGARCALMVANHPPHPQPPTRTHTRARTHNTCARARTYAHKARTHAKTQNSRTCAAYIRAHTHARPPAHERAHARARTKTHALARTQKHICTHTYTSTHSPRPAPPPLRRSLALSLFCAGEHTPGPCGLFSQVSRGVLGGTAEVLGWMRCPR
jgi:hypothetical protein